MYPPEHEISKALLRHILDHGGPEAEVRSSTVYEPLADLFGLSRQERTQTRDQVYGDGNQTPIWNNKVQWARNSLRKQGYLAPSPRGIWRLYPNLKASN